MTGSFDAKTGYALILTHSAAYVFSYLHAGPDNHPVTLAFPLPPDVGKDGRTNKEILPLGVLVAPCAGCDEPGLVIVMPISGRIAYWESIGGAIAEGLMHRKSIESRIPLVSGEICVYLCNAEVVLFLSIVFLLLIYIKACKFRISNVFGKAFAFVSCRFISTTSHWIVEYG